MSNRTVYFSKHKITMVPLNRWDMMALTLILALLALLSLGAHQMAGPFHMGDTLTIHLSPKYLPLYGLRSVLRMFFALAVSLLFTFIFGTLAAKNRHAERLIIPAIDILQSVPILGFLSVTVVGFIHLFRGSLLGPECASIFVIFTSQVWNMVLSFYQSLRTVPEDLLEAAAMYRLSAWQRFWRIEVPFAMPALLWNTMMSMSASWFFVVASEAITVANQNITLPGIGSYIAEAIKQANMFAVAYAILSMFIIILLYDQILFRPLNKWAEKFKLDSIPQENVAENWLFKLLQRTQWIKYSAYFFGKATDLFINFRLFNRTIYSQREIDPYWSKWLVVLWYVVLVAALIFAVEQLVFFIAEHITLKEIGKVFLLGCITAVRIFIVVLLCTLVWVPIGVWIGQRPKVAQIAQPTMQFLAAFPAYLFFPVFVLLIVKFHLNIEIWVTPLLILGTQWYIAFNVIAGTAAIPKDLHLAIKNFHVTGWLKWLRFIIPGIFPYYITGAITAVGNSWNTTIVAEVVSWGSVTLKATGLGAYISQYTTTGDYPRIALGVAVMCIFVLVLNRIIWRPLYNLAEQRFRLD